MTAKAVCLLAIILSSLFIALAQREVAKRRIIDDQQQVQAPVGRINLRDFGIVKHDRRQESHEEDDVQPEDVKIFDASVDRPRPPRVFSPSSSRSFDCKDCVDQRYLQHYASKGCLPVMSSSCNCPIRFDCPFDRSTNTTECHFGGRAYQIGSRIPVKNPCRICSCRDFGRRRGAPLKAVIDCGIGIECPEDFGVRPPRDCYTFYEHDSCCGRDECPNRLDAKRTPKVCSYKGRSYKLGQKIYPDEDPCKTCICSEDWNDDQPLTSLSCRRHECEFELDRDFREGCLPIYHEGTCCPIEYHCPKKLVPTQPSGSSTECVFEGRKYPLGAKLEHSNVCVECLCRVPPDFTCVHRSCPTPDANCYVANWNASVCCQKYTCGRPAAERDESQLRGGFFSARNN